MIPSHYPRSPAVTSYLTGSISSPLSLHLYICDVKRQLTNTVFATLNPLLYISFKMVKPDHYSLQIYLLCKFKWYVKYVSALFSCIDSWILYAIFISTKFYLLSRIYFWAQKLFAYCRLMWLQTACWAIIQPSSWC